MNCKASLSEREIAMSGYKYEAYLIAEELAEERYGKTFYECTGDQQLELYEAGIRGYIERCLDPIVFGNYSRISKRSSALQTHTTGKTQEERTK